MKSRNLVGCGIAVLALTACGRSYQGSYRGTELITQNYDTTATQTAQSFSDALTLSMNDASGGSVTGTYQGGSQTGTIQGTASGTGIDNVVLTITAPAYSNQTSYNQPYSSGYYYGQTTSTTTASCGGVFIGNLALSNNRLTGTLRAQSATTCGITSITVDASK